MDDGLKQRLIGAFVLLALAVIFIPVVFDRERIAPVDKKTQIPTVPEIETVALEKAAPPEVPNDIKPAAQMFMPDEAEVVAAQQETKKKTPQKIVSKKMDKNGVPISWVLQVASYRFQDRATALRETLGKEGHRAFIRRAVTEHGKTWRVYVGPKLERSALAKKQDAINKRHKVKTLLLRLRP